MIAQSRVEGGHLPELFLYDTHGSVRGLLNLQGRTREIYDYNAFGMAGDCYTLNVNPTSTQTLETDRVLLPLSESGANACTNACTCWRQS